MVCNRPEFVSMDNRNILCYITRNCFLRCCVGRYIGLKHRKSIVLNLFLPYVYIFAHDKEKYNTIDMCVCIKHTNMNVENNIPVSASQMSAWPLQLHLAQVANGPPLGGSW